MLGKLLGENYLRRRLLKKTDSPVMKMFYENPFPARNSLISELDIVSLDFETTGLNREKDRIISIGRVQISQLGIELGSSSHELIKTNTQLSENSVVIHQITDDQSATGSDVENVLPQLLDNLSGKVLLAHNAKVEVGFINALCQRLYGTNFVIPVIDTQILAKRSFERQHLAYRNNELRLFNLRKLFNMPVYKAHNALMDAVATAELFLALFYKISPRSNGRLSEFLS